MIRVPEGICRLQFLGSQGHWLTLTTGPLAYLVAYSRQYFSSIPPQQARPARIIPAGKIVSDHGPELP